MSDDEDKDATFNTTCPHCGNPFADRIGVTKSVQRELRRYMPGYPQPDDVIESTWYKCPDCKKDFAVVEQDGPQPGFQLVAPCCKLVLINPPIGVHRTACDRYAICPVCQEKVWH